MRCTARRPRPERRRRRGYTVVSLGAIAQLGERLDRTQEVAGSSPASSMAVCSMGIGRDRPPSEAAVLLQPVLRWDRQTCDGDRCGHQQHGREDEQTGANRPDREVAADSDEEEHARENHGPSDVGSNRRTARAWPGRARAPMIDRSTARASDSRRSNARIHSRPTGPFDLPGGNDACRRRSSTSESWRM
jgi:hypothetical protein